MAQVLITNLGSDPLSFDITVGDVTVRDTIPGGGYIDVGDRIAVDDLNQSEVVKDLIAANKISITSEAEPDDIAAEVILNVSTYLGTPVVADPDRIVAAIQIADGAQILAAQPDVPRNLTMTLTDADDSVTATIVATGVDPSGRTVTETMQPDGAGGGKTLVGTKIFASVTSVVVSNTVGSAPGDNLEVGIGDVIGLPSDISNVTAVKYTSLGGVPVTPDAVATGVSTSGVDVNGATYDGAKVMQVFYNTGE